MKQSSSSPPARPAWWKSVGPAFITACVVFGPGSLVINANMGATYGYELLWLLLLAGILMGTYVTMSARIGVTTGASHFDTLKEKAAALFPQHWVSSCA